MGKKKLTAMYTVSERYDILKVTGFTMKRNYTNLTKKKYLQKNW